MELGIRVKQTILRRKLNRDIYKSKKAIKYSFPIVLSSIERNPFGLITAPIRLGYDLLPKVMPEILKRLRIAETEYVIIRRLDDLFDGDVKGKNPAEYMEHIKELLQGKTTPSNWLEESLVQNREDARELGEEVVSELEVATNNLIRAWCFDISRMNYLKDNDIVQMHPESDINDYFRKTELTGIAKGFLAIMGEESGQLDKIAPLIRAARKNFYFIRDLAEDVAEGRVNVPLEYISNFSDSQLHELRKHCANFKTAHYRLFTGGFLSPLSERFYQKLPEEVQCWIEDQIKEGIYCLEKYKEIKEGLSLRKTTKRLLASMYEGETICNLEGLADMRGIKFTENNSDIARIAAITTLFNELIHGTNHLKRRYVTRPIYNNIIKPIMQPKYLI